MWISVAVGEAGLGLGAVQLHHHLSLCFPSCSKLTAELEGRKSSVLQQGRTCVVGCWRARGSLCKGCRCPTWAGPMSRDREEWLIAENVFLCSFLTVQLA